ncbi:uncharacterized protein JCM10292_007601 [Rhodotorula paludigena]|uniref:uncharacterized protein n=1 Tax=Rhodotorula paludigena TaxID=86838 RepID=UPI003175D283
MVWPPEGSAHPPNASGSSRPPPPARAGEPPSPTERPVYGQSWGQSISPDRALQYSPGRTYVQPRSNSFSGPSSSAPLLSRMDGGQASSGGAGWTSYNGSNAASSSTVKSNGPMLLNRLGSSSAGKSTSTTTSTALPAHAPDSRSLLNRMKPKSGSSNPKAEQSTPLHAAPTQPPAKAKRASFDLLRRLDEPAQSRTASPETFQPSSAFSPFARTPSLDRAGSQPKPQQSKQKKLQNSAQPNVPKKHSPAPQQSSLASRLGGFTSHAGPSDAQSPVLTTAASRSRSGSAFSSPRSTPAPTFSSSATAGIEPGRFVRSNQPANVSTSSTSQAFSINGRGQKLSINGRPRDSSGVVGNAAAPSPPDPNSSIPVPAPVVAANASTISNAQAERISPRASASDTTTAPPAVPLSPSPAEAGTPPLRPRDLSGAHSTAALAPAPPAAVPSPPVSPRRIPAALKKTLAASPRARAAPDLAPPPPTSSAPVTAPVLHEPARAEEPAPFIKPEPPSPPRAPPAADPAPAPTAMGSLLSRIKPDPERDAAADAELLRQKTAELEDLERAAERARARDAEREKERVAAQEQEKKRREAHRRDELERELDEHVARRRDEETAAVVAAKRAREKEREAEPHREPQLAANRAKVDAAEEEFAQRKRTEEAKKRIDEEKRKAEEASRALRAAEVKKRLEAERARSASVGATSAAGSSTSNGPSQLPTTALWDKHIPALHKRTSYLWAVPAGQPALAELVQDRKRIFRKQRAFATDAERQKRSYDAVATHVGAANWSPNVKTMYKYKVRDYASFCRSLDLPPWPMTAAVIALFLHAAHPDTLATSTRQTYQNKIDIVRRVCSDVWAGVPGCCELNAWPGAQQAIHEWKTAKPALSTGDSTGQSARGTSPEEQLPATSDEEWLEDPDDGDEQDLAKYAFECRKTVWQYPTPGIPATGQLFDRLSDLYRATAVAVVPVLGIGIQLRKRGVRCNRHNEGCPFRITAEPAGGTKVRVTAKTIYEHNHDRNPKIAEDPSWRPFVRNKVAREAIEEHDQAHARRTSNSSRKRAKSPVQAPSPKKQARRLSNESRATAASPALSSTKKLAEAAVSTEEVQDDVTPLTTHPTPPARPPTPINAAAPSPPPAASIRPNISQLLVPDGSTFRPSLRAFLVRVDPSLSAFADPLIAAGIISPRHLALFLQLEPSSRLALYEDLSIEGEAAMLDVQAIERFEAAIAAGQAGRWAT